MTTYTSTLPQDLIDRLNSAARELNIPKNKIIEKALNVYLTEIDKAAFAASFTQAREDKDLLSIAEEGMGEYLSTLKEWDETG